MIRTVKVTNNLGKSLTLDVRGSDTSGLLIAGIDGLGQSKANINFSKNATSDGEIFNSAYLETRNIVLYMFYKDTPSVEVNRRTSYEYFPTKKEIEMVFTTDSGDFVITGHVESNEPNIFSSKSGTQISIICADPYFYSLSNFLTIFYGVEALFEFEFSNESLTEDLIEFGMISNNTQNTVYYDGDADTGVTIVIQSTGDASGIKIYNLKEHTQMFINSTKLVALTGSDIILGDEIIISTLENNKYIYLLRDGLYINIINCLDKNTDWFTISKGDNEFVYTADEGITKLQFSIYHKNRYIGI